MIIDSKFLDEFNLWFNHDLIRWDDRPRMMQDAFWIADRVAGWLQANEILQQLDFVLEMQRPDEVLPFIEKTWVDWNADEATETLFFEILALIRDCLAELLKRPASSRAGVCA